MTNNLHFLTISKYSEFPTLWTYCWHGEIAPHWIKCSQNFDVQKFEYRKKKTAK